MRLKIPHESMYVCIYMDVIMDSSRLIIVITIPD